MSEFVARSKTVLRLEDRIRIGNASPTVGVTAIERFHRQSSLLRRTRFGLEIGPYHDLDVYSQVVGRQTRLSDIKVVDLAEPAPGGAINLERWPSQREFEEVADLDFSVFSDFLYQAYSHGTSQGRRPPCASAGELYPVHVLALPLVAMANAPFERDSILHLAAQESALYQVASSGARAAALVCMDCELGTEPNSFVNAAFLIAYVIDLELAALRYAERGYRFSLVESGLMAQQATLVGQRLGLGTCIFGGFPDAEFCAALRLNTKKMLPCIVQVFGRPRKAALAAFIP